MGFDWPIMALNRWYGMGLLHPELQAWSTKYEYTVPLELVGALAERIFGCIVVSTGSGVLRALAASAS